MPTLRDWISLATCGVLAVQLRLFFYVDWDRGVERFFLLLLLAATLLSARALLRPRIEQRPHARRATLWMAMILVVLGLGYHYLTGVRTILRTVRTDRIALDQGQLLYRAMLLLKQGFNPYSQRAMLDPVEYKNAVERWKHCLTFAGDPHRALEHFWDRSHGVEEMGALFPTSYGDGESCRGARADFQRRGMHYGPLQLLVYLPGFAVFGKSGLYLTNVVMFTLLCLVVGLGLSRQLGASRVLSLLGLAVLLLPRHIAHNTLNLSAADLLPVLLAQYALFSLYADRPTRSAVSLGLSMASKLLPGLLYAPLLLRARKRHWGQLGLMAVLIYLPFAIWSPAGMMSNVLVYAYTRGYDSTSLSYFISAGARVVLQVAIAATLLALLCWAHRGLWSLDRALVFLLAAHLGVFAGGTYFHNNYLVWLLPVVAAFTVCALGACPTGGRADEGAV